MKKKTCLIISGPTAVGKTFLAIELAKQYQTQIISADSRQCYDELNIGVAKPTSQQLKEIKHYFINSHSIHDEVNVKVFEEYALKAAENIFKENDIAIVVGGTGLYLKAFCEGLDEIPAIDPFIDREVNENYRQQGFSWLEEELKMKDPLFFAKGEMQNIQRMLRALQVKIATGKSILEFQTGIKKYRSFEIKNKVLSLPREILYNQINQRVDQMIEAGLLQEVESLVPFKHLNALQTVGYKELFDYLEGKISLSAAVDNIKKNTRHFAKRQITWFKKYQNYNLV
jgi:tRNA dimethylallyltransferase